MHYVRTNSKLSQDDNNDDGLYVCWIDICLEGPIGISNVNFDDDKYKVSGYLNKINIKLLILLL